MNRVKKYKVYTRLEILFGKKYKDHIIVGKKFWSFFDCNTQIFKLTQQHWNKLEVTYIRSGVVFYSIENITGEFHFDIDSIMAMQLEPEFLDPKKDLRSTIDNLEKFYFKSEKTQIINFKNTEYYDKIYLVTKNGRCLSRFDNEDSANSYAKLVNGIVSEDINIYNI